jgi:hypothetical protein
MALEIDAVSPFRRASNILNFLTDDSIETPFSPACDVCDPDADIGAGADREGIVLCGCKFEVDLISPAVPVDGRGACPLEGW